jgi:hypothetical protein
MANPNPFASTEAQFREERKQRIAGLHWKAILWGTFVPLVIVCGETFVNHDPTYRSPLQIFIVFAIFLAGSYLMEFWRFHRWEARKRREQQEEAQGSVPSGLRKG